MGLFRLKSSSSSVSYNPHSMSTNTTIPIDGRVTSSAQSVRSTHSNSTVKATSPPGTSTLTPGMSGTTSGGSTTGTIFPYAVGKPSTFHNDNNIAMDDPFVTTLASQVGHGYPQSHSQPHHAHHPHRHRIDSQGVPIPPARTTSLGHPPDIASSTSLPSVQVTIATPTKQRKKAEAAEQHSRPYQGGGYQYSTSFGSGSLDINDGGFSYSHGLEYGQNQGQGQGNEDGGFSVPPHYNSSTDQLTSTSYTSMDEESDSEEKRKLDEEEMKKEKVRKQGRDRQKRKRDRDRAERQAAKALQAQLKAQGHVSPPQVFHPPVNPSIQDQAIVTSTVDMSRNTSTASLGLAPIIVPHPSLSINPQGPSSASSIYSSLPNSASFLSLSPNTPHTQHSQQTSGNSSPTTFFSPMTPATTSTSASTSLHGGYPWSNTTTGNRASKSAVDIRSSQLTKTTNSNRNQVRQQSKGKGMIIHPPPHRAPLGGTSNQSYSAKRRRSEPEPEQFKAKEVGLGVIGLPQPMEGHGHSQDQEQGPIEFLSTPPNDHGSGYKGKERPGIRRTASDSAATALEFSGHLVHGHSHGHVHGPQSRSPTPPLLDSLKTEHLTLDEEMPAYQPEMEANIGASQTQGNGFADLLASTALIALVDNPNEDIQRALVGLKLSRENLMGLQADLAGFFGRYSLEKEMGAVSLDDRPSGPYPMSMSGFTSHATTPYHHSVPLSTTSTRPPSPSPLPLFTHSELNPSLVEQAQTHAIPAIITRASASKATPKSTKTPSRARSLSSASMRARGLKMSSTTTASKSPAQAPIQGQSIYQETSYSPMSFTPYQFPHQPNTPSVPMSMVDSDGASASPMMSSVQTPTTGQGAFPHHEILAIGQGTMRVDQGRAHEVQDAHGGRSRTATDPGKYNHGHQRHGSNWEQGRGHQNHQQHRSSNSYSQSFNSSGLSSPLDMTFRPQDQMPAPPPHLPPSFAYMPTSMSMAQAPFTPSHSGQRNRSHTSTGLSTPFTPTPISHRASIHSHSGHGQGIYQPTFTPIHEIGTPTRPSPRPTTGEGRMMAYDPRNASAGGMDGLVFGPSSDPQGQVTGQVQMSMPEGNWMAFGQGQGQVVPNAGEVGSEDPFGGSLGGSTHGPG